MPDCSFVQRLERCPACGVGWMQVTRSYQDPPASVSPVTWVEVRSCDRCGHEIEDRMRVTITSSTDE